MPARSGEKKGGGWFCGTGGGLAWANQSPNPKKEGAGWPETSLPPGVYGPAVVSSFFEGGLSKKGSKPPSLSSKKAQPHKSRRKGRADAQRARHETHRPTRISEALFASRKTLLLLGSRCRSKTLRLCVYVHRRGIRRFDRGRARKVHFFGGEGGCVCVRFQFTLSHLSCR